jgi:large subunit ribosomal protein L24
MKANTNVPKKIHLKKGDKVKVLSGNSKGKTGEVLQVFPSKYRAIVKDVNIVSKHIKPSAANPNGGIEKTEAPVHISNLMVINPATGNASRVGKKMNDEGKLERYFKS